jgi:hypothetical protein
MDGSGGFANAAFEAGYGDQHGLNLDRIGESETICECEVSKILLL